MTTSPSTADPLAGAPVDLGILERLANELFRGVTPPSLPSGIPTAPAGLSPAGYGPSVPVTSPVPTLPPTSLPTSPGGFSPAGFVPSGPVVPAVPTGFTPSGPALPAAATPPGFSPIAPSSALALPGVPGEADLRALLARPTAPAFPQPAALADPEPAALFPTFGPGLPATPAATGQPGDLSGRAAASTFPAERIRAEFPILNERVHGKRLIWLDNAATTQKPRAVIDRLSRFYQTENSNIHRAAHTLAARATDAYEGARESVRRFIGAGSADEIIFVRGATEGINLVARTWGRTNLKPGDEVLVSHLEHHANIVPWQQVTAGTGATLKVIPVDDRGALDLDAYARLLNPKVKIVAITQVANAIGTVVPIRQVTELAHAAGAIVLVDGAQSVSHMPVDVRALGADFFVFSGHKVFGPTGIGAVYGRKELLDRLPPWQGGGNMIKDVTFEKTEYHGAPARFEAGTGSIADAVGLGAALDWLDAIGRDRVAAYEHHLIAYLTPRLAAIPGVRILGDPPERAGVVSFVLNGYTTTEVGQLLDKEGIAVRSGHHCAQPILRRLGVEASVRPSFALYNTCADLDALIAAVTRLAAARR